jgi:hypothetical protein
MPLEYPQKKRKFREYTKKSAHKKRKHQETMCSLMFSGGEKTLA